MHLINWGELRVSRPKRSILLALCQRNADIIRRSKYFGHTFRAFRTSSFLGLLSSKPVLRCSSLDSASDISSINDLGHGHISASTISIPLSKDLHSLICQ